MKSHPWFAATLALLFVPGASAEHVDPCFVTSAPPGTYLVIEAGGRTFYDEERGNPMGAPIPLSGFLFDNSEHDGLPELFEGEGSWIYEESNNLEDLQRGGIGLLGDWFPPGCDTNPDWDPTTSPVGSYPCLIIDEDPINDETCHRGPDTLIV